MSPGGGTNLEACNLQATGLETNYWIRSYHTAGIREAVGRRRDAGRAIVRVRTDTGHWVVVIVYVKLAPEISPLKFHCEIS